MKRTSIKKKSAKQELRDEIGILHRKYLKHNRNNFNLCEICGKPGQLGRFHILSVGAHPKLEFVDFNVLLTHWYPCHSEWHHSYSKGKEIEKRIIELRGKDYKQKLLALEKMQPKHTMFHLSNLYHWFRHELIKIKGPQS